MRPWPNIRNKPPIIQREFRGVNKLDSFSLSDAYSPDSSNTISSKYPSLSVRQGYSVLGASYGRVLGMGVWKDTELHAIFNDGVWRRWNGSAWVTVKTGLSTTAIPSFTNLKGDLSNISLFMANGIDGLLYYDGTTVATMTDAPAGLNYLENHVDRIFGASGNTLYCSGYRKASEWTVVREDDTDPFNTEVETPNGEVITAVEADSSALIVTKRSSLHKLFGYAGSDFSLRRVSREIGALNNNSVFMVKNVLYLVDSRGIYDYFGSTSPENNFSRPVQDYIDKMQPSSYNGVCVGSEGKYLYIAGTASNTVLVHDLENGAWHVWNDISATCFAKMGDTLYIGDSRGRVLKLGGTTNNGAVINWHWTSIPYTAESMAQIVRLTRMWFTVELAAGSTLSVYLSKTADGDDWQLAQTFTANGLTATPVYVPTHLIANANWYRYKLVGSGPCTVKEFAREQHNMPIR